MDCSCFSGVVSAVGESNEEETNCLMFHAFNVYN
jgi:hypothetical protein